MKKIIFLLFILSCLFNSCKSIDFANQNSVFIMLYDFDNAPLKDVVIKVDDKVIGQSDVNGRFVFDVYDLERHSVVISKEGYETIFFGLYICDADHCLDVVNDREISDYKMIDNLLLWIKSRSKDINLSKIYL